DTARRLIEQNGKTPWGYYALAEALEERRQYQAVIDSLAPIVAAPSPGFDTGVLLPHLGFAYQEIGDHDKAIATFEEARRKSPGDPNLASYLVEANLAAKKYAAAIEAAQSALNDHPDDLRLIRLQAQALRRSGKPDQGIALLEGALKKHGDDPTAYIALAQIYADAERTPEAVRVLQEGESKFPSDVSLMFELGSVYDRQKKYPDAEQLKNNAVIQEHYGEVLFKLGRYNDAIAAWTRALAGDGSDIDRADVDKKIRAAKQKLNQK